MKERIDAALNAFERLSSREQSLLLLVCVLVLVGVVGFSSLFLSRSLARQDKRIEAKLEQLQEVARLRADYQARLREKQRLTAEVRANRGTRILSHVERVAREVGVELKNASQRAGRATGSPQVVEEMAEVRIMAVSINRLDDFLKGLDGGSRLIVVRGVRIEKNFENPELLNATISVGTFKTRGPS